MTNFVNSNLKSLHVQDTTQTDCVLSFRHLIFWETCFSEASIGPAQRHLIRTVAQFIQTTCTLFKEYCTDYALFNWPFLVILLVILQYCSTARISKEIKRSTGAHMKRLYVNKLSAQAPCPQVKSPNQTHSRKPTWRCKRRPNYTRCHHRRHRRPWCPWVTLPTVRAERTWRGGGGRRRPKWDVVAVSVVIRSNVSNGSLVVSSAADPCCCCSVLFFFFFFVILGPVL